MTYTKASDLKASHPLLSVFNDEKIEAIITETNNYLESYLSEIQERVINA